MKLKNSGRLWLIWISAICAAILSLAPLATRATEIPDVDIKIDRVALFKNGLGFFTSSATLPEGATTVRLGQLPVPSHGTFWVAYPKDLKLRALFTSMEDVEKKTSVRSLAEMLQANVGRQVTVSTGSEETPSISGTIVGVMPRDEPTENPSPYTMDTRRQTSGRRHQSHRAPSLVLIATEDKSVALSAGSITRADFKGDGVVTSISSRLKQPSIRIELEEAASGERIGASYLARGITWSPSYLIDVSHSKKARLSAKALVINEVADLEGVQLEFVTGFPNLQFEQVNSPVAMSQDLEGFLKALTTGRSESRERRDVISQRALMSNVAVFREYEASPVPGYSTAREGTVSEDLFLYPVDKFSLRRGETACIPLFSAEVPYQHIYIWKIPDMLDKDERYRRRRERDEDLPSEEVWHSCRLVNTMSMPWTTAPAEFVKDGQITGQDVCYYTAPGTKTTIRINRAMNVLAEESELEVERERNVTKFHGSHYDLVKVKGELKLINRLGKAATVEVTKNLSGEVLETNPKATDTPTAKGLKRVNPRHQLLWEIELEPGGDQSLSYTYEVYVRS